MPKRADGRGMPASRSRRGISLLEAVVGMAIVGMTAAAGAGMVAAELRLAERSRRALEAAALATHRLTLLDFLTESELRLLPDSVQEGRFEPPLDEYGWSTTASPRDGERGVHDVTIRIEWDGGAYTVETAVYRRPPVVSR